MPESLSFSIDDHDIRWSARALGLDEFAFHGENGDDPRAAVLKMLDSADVAACPGSGKTTLLVAKLAILARDWAAPTSGMCVLSHTNAARHEIERKLGHTEFGKRLLGYPHFVGTIHAFLNEYLALPWLRSLGYKIHVIDNPITCWQVWKRVPSNLRQGLLHRRVHPESIRMEDVQFNPTLLQRDFPVLPSSNTFKAVREALRATADDGFFRHDDSLVWANSLLDRDSSVLEALQSRFPLCFVDEAQDNSEPQSAILKRIFGTENSLVVLQRFGDANQAIFGFAGQSEAETDRFPVLDKMIEIPNSHRFGSAIARLGGSLAVAPYSTPISGDGPGLAVPESTASYPHTIFLFDSDTLGSVLGAFGDLILSCFPSELITQGRFCAVCQVHNEGEKEKEGNLPYRIGNYWPPYNASAVAPSAAPRSFREHVERGLAQSRALGHSSPAVNAICRGIYHLASRSNPSFRSGSRIHIYRLVRKLLAGSALGSEKLTQIIRRFALSHLPMTAEEWREEWRPAVKETASDLAGKALDLSPSDPYLEWGTSPVASENAERTNAFRYPNEKPQIEIELSTIHAVKGQTHTATLVLESFWHKHNIESILDWLTEDRKNWDSSNQVRDKTRLHLHFVAMTRPSHLLCVALLRRSIETSPGSLDSTRVDKLKSVGWSIVDLTEQAPAS